MQIHHYCHTTAAVRFPGPRSVTIDPVQAWEVRPGRRKAARPDKAGGFAAGVRKIGVRRRP
jgi:hypothetical protein